MPGACQNVARDPCIRQGTADCRGHADRLKIGLDCAGDPRGNKAVHQRIRIRHSLFHYPRRCLVLDDDRNGWIDESDAAFDRLQVWTRDGAGTDRLQSLGEAGVGAIGLGNIATPFDIKNNANQLLGQIRSSGIVLQENGAAGTIQQIDLTA